MFVAKFRIVVPIYDSQELRIFENRPRVERRDREVDTFTLEKTTGSQKVEKGGSFLAFSREHARRGEDSVARPCSY